MPATRCSPEIKWQNHANPQITHPRTVLRVGNYEVQAHGILITVSDRAMSGWNTGWKVYGIPTRKETRMANSTRRSLLRDGCAALGAATLISLNLPEPARAGSQPASVFHVFAFQWKPGTPEAQKDRAAKEISAFQGVIPGLLQTHVGPNISPRGKGYSFGGIMQFRDKASLDDYVKHPAHQALLAWLVPLIDAIELDLHA